MVRGSDMEKAKQINQMQLGEFFKGNLNYENVPEEINSPAHYTTGKIEVIDYILDKLTGEQFEGYCVGNVLKYVSCYQHKGGYKDLQKAHWYLNKLLETEKP